MIKLLSVILYIGMSVVQASSASDDESAHPKPVLEEGEERRVRQLHVEDRGLLYLLEVLGFHISSFFSIGDVRGLRLTSGTTPLLVDEYRKPFIHRGPEIQPYVPMSRFLRAAAPRGYSEFALTNVSHLTNYAHVIAYYKDMHENAVGFRRVKLIIDRNAFHPIYNLSGGSIEFTMDFTEELFPENFGTIPVLYQSVLLECILRNAVKIHSVNVMRTQHFQALIPYLDKTEKVIMKTLPDAAIVGALANWAQRKIENELDYEWTVSEIHSAMIRNAPESYFNDIADHLRYVTSVEDNSLPMFVQQLDPKVFKFLAINPENFNRLNEDGLANFTNLTCIHIENTDLEILLTLPSTTRLNIRELRIALPLPVPMAHIILQFPNLSQFHVDIPDLSQGPLDLTFIDQLHHLRVLHASDSPRDVIDDDFHVMLPERLNVEVFSLSGLEPVQPVTLTHRTVTVARFIPGKIIFEGNTHIAVEAMASSNELPILHEALPPTIQSFTGPTDFYLDDDSDDESDDEDE